MSTVAELAVAITAQNSASEVLHQVQRDLDATHKAAIAAGVGLTALGASMAAGLLAAGQAAASFEQAMSQVTAVLSPLERAANAPALKELALTLGRDTVFSANEAASALEELVKAGVSVADVMGGAAAASLNLAAAGGVSVKEAATIAANAMNAFGLSGEKVGAVVDTIAGAANASAIDVSQFGMALSQVGAVANLAGLNFSDTATAIALMGNAGVKGSDAGTSLKVMFTELIPKSAGAAAELQKLGIITAAGANQFFDAAGKTKSYAEIAGVLATATAGLTEQQKLFTFHQIFGTDGMRAAAIAAKAGAEGVRALTDEMGKVSALEVAHERLNNLNGDMKLLTSSLETLAITFGGNLAPAMRPVTQEVTNVVNALAGMPTAAMQTAAAVATIATGATLLAGSILIATGAAAAMGTTLGALAIAAAPVVVPIAAIGVALGLLAAAWINDWGGIQSKTTDATGSIQTDLQATGKGLDVLGRQAHDATTAMGELLGRFAEWDARAQQNVQPTSLGPLQTSQGANLAQLFPARSEAAEIVAQAEDLGRKYADALAHTLADSLENGLGEQRVGERMANKIGTGLDTLVPILADAGTESGEAMGNAVVNASQKAADKAGAIYAEMGGNVQKAIAQAVAESGSAAEAEQLVGQILQRANAVKAVQQALETLTPVERAHYEVLLTQTNAQTVLNDMLAAGKITQEQYANALERGSTGLAGQTAKTEAHTKAVKESTTAVLTWAEAEKKLADATTQVVNAQLLARVKGQTAFTEEAGNANAKSVLQALTAGQGVAAEGWAKYVSEIGEAEEATRQWATAHQLDATLVEKALNGDTAAMKRLTDEIKRAQEAAAKGIQLSSNISASGSGLGLAPPNNAGPRGVPAIVAGWDAFENQIITGFKTAGDQIADNIKRAGTQGGAAITSAADNMAIKLQAAAQQLAIAASASGGTRYGASPDAPGSILGPSARLGPLVEAYMRAHPEEMENVLTSIMGPAEGRSSLGAGPLQEQQFRAELQRRAELEQNVQAGQQIAGKAGAGQRTEELGKATEGTTAAMKGLTTATQGQGIAANGTILTNEQLQAELLKAGSAVDALGQGMNFAGAASARAGLAALDMTHNVVMAGAAAAAAAESFKIAAANAQALMAGSIRNAGVAGGVTQKGLTYTEIMGGQTPGSSTGISGIGTYYGLPVVSGSPITPGSLRGYADGGWVNEPVVGRGLRSGAGYTFGERGPEYVSPGGGGTTINLTINASGVDALQDNMFWESVYDKQLQPLFKRRGVPR